MAPYNGDFNKTFKKMNQYANKKGYYLKDLVEYINDESKELIEDDKFNLYVISIDNHMLKFKITVWGDDHFKKQLDKAIEFLDSKRFQ